MATRRLAEALRLFDQNLHFADPSPLLVTLGVVGAHQLGGPPVSVLLVGPASAGKTECIRPIERLPGVFPTATITEAGLLSGSSSADHNDSTTGGLLREIGESGIITAKDFGSVLSMHRDARAAVLAALREIYDGSWTRRLGTDGGRSFSWRGRVSFIGGCTEDIEKHHAVMASMGERFVLLRMPPISPEHQALAAIRADRDDDAFRASLAAAVRAVVDEIDPTRVSELSPNERDGIAALASLVAASRSSVTRDGSSRAIEHVPGSEGPARLAKALDQLRRGLEAVGLDAASARRLVGKVAFDSIPSVRGAVFRALAKRSEAATVEAIGSELGGVSKSATWRTLEDLEAHGVIVRQRSKSDLWSLSERTRERLAAITGFADCFAAPFALSVSEMSSSAPEFPAPVALISEA